MTGAIHFPFVKLKLNCRVSDAANKMPHYRAKQFSGGQEPEQVRGNKRFRLSLSMGTQYFVSPEKVLKGYFPQSSRPNMWPPRANQVWYQSDKT